MKAYYWRLMGDFGRYIIELRLQENYFVFADRTLQAYQRAKVIVTIFLFISH